MRRHWKVTALLALLVLLTSATGCGGKEAKPVDTAREYLRWLGQGDIPRAKEMEVYPAQGVALEKQREDWQTRQELLRKIAVGIGKPYQELGEAKLELTREDSPTRVEVTAYWSDMLIHLTLNQVNGKWRVAEARTETAGRLVRRAGVLAAMSQHGQIPQWLDSLEPYWNSDKKWVDSQGFADSSWINAYQDVKNKVGKLESVVSTFAKGEMDQDVLNFAAVFRSMSLEVEREIELSTGAGMPVDKEMMMKEILLSLGTGKPITVPGPNDPALKEHVPRARAAYDNWRSQYAGQIPVMKREDAVQVMDAAVGVLKVSGQWNIVYDSILRSWEETR